MQLTKCENNHFYDSDKFLSCPHCANQMAGVTIQDPLGANQNQIPTATPQSGNVQKYEQLTYGKTVGWLVCIEGTMVGESFPLREGDNFIGRAANMDIALIYETTVSREKHAVISYDPKKNVCVLYSQNHHDQTFCNARQVKSRRTLKNRDVITFGDCSFIFVPFCNSSFSWSANTDTQEAVP